MRNLLAQRGLRLLGQRTQQRGLEQTGGDGAYPDQLARQVARDRQRHADDAALGRGVGGLTDLTLERGHRGGVDDDAALAVDGLGLGHAFGGQPDHVERADQVDLDDLGEAVEGERTVLAQRLDGVADAGAVDVDTQRAHLLGGVERRADLLGVGDVGFDELGARTQLLDRVLALEVDHDDGCAAIQQALGGRQPEPGRTSGDDCYGVLDLHRSVPFCYLTRPMRTSNPFPQNGFGIGAGNAGRLGRRR